MISILGFRSKRPQSNQRGIETCTPGAVQKWMARPQSNQRGIETAYTLSLVFAIVIGLNRTSVGLKRAHRRRPSSAFPDRPQSNQRGIETRSPAATARPSSAPQSNQRGIETHFRTHVNLLLLVPQSNQRGIETGVRAEGAEVHRVGLNRTSVGLKPLQAGFLAPKKQPQSNQRGIETLPGALSDPKQAVGLNRTSVGLKLWRISVWRI